MTRNRIREAAPSLPTPLTLWGSLSIVSDEGKDIMITDVIVVNPDDTIKEVLALSEK